MSRTTSWSDVRAKRPVDEVAVADHVARMEAEERAYRLREIREEQGVTQKELAERMKLTQPPTTTMAMIPTKITARPTPCGTSSLWKGWIAAVGAAVLARTVGTMSSINARIRAAVRDRLYMTETLLFVYSVTKDSCFGYDIDHV